MKKSRRKSGSPLSPFRRSLRRASLCSLLVFAMLCTVSCWYARHPLSWLNETESSWPHLVTEPLRYLGDRTAFFTDALGFTGRDVVYDYDEPAPEGRIFFAGPPRRTGAPAPTDIHLLARDEFTLGWSPSLGHSVWAAYHVPPKASYEADRRPNFRKDPDVPSSPPASAYEHTGYDRGHLVPNHAIESRFGPDAQRQTFFTTNIAPQRPSLNRGPWREIEHRITELWSACYGEVWVLIGTLPGGGEKLSGSSIDVPSAFWCVLVAQDEDGVRVLALILPQTVPGDAFPVHYLVSIDEIERRTGFDLLPELPEFLSKPLEAETPTRLWPMRFLDILKLIALRFPTY